MDIGKPKANSVVAFIKAQAASLIATACDFITTVLCVELMHIQPVPATVTGNVFGGVINFSLGRNWVFTAKGESSLYQGLKYILVWLGNLLLNAVGMYILAIKLHVDYILSKLAVSLMVGVLYNYFFQKRYVFNKV
ncbi:MAG: GtrA family protein [Flavipsychrobacter sp.]|nr:GtrA family protein [Flavipsychrobacter sp.]